MDCIHNEIPAEIREQLKRHSKHHPDVTCLECGYRGMMGIKTFGRKILLSIVIALAITIGLAIVGIGGVVLSGAIFGAVVTIALQKTARPIVTCPSCNRDLAI